jgi:hypothetical protein
MLSSILELGNDLETIRSGGRRPGMFGEASHEYGVNPPLSENDLVLFEAAYEVELPEDYRLFLRHVGNGGAGPAYGLFKLGEMDHGHDHGPWGDFVADLAAPFPHTSTWNDLTGQPEDFEGDPDTPDEEEYWRQVEKFEERYFDPRNTQGSFPLCHVGCAIRLRLVISGPERGNVWNDDTANFTGLSPLQTGQCKRTTFYQWYRHWLDEALAKLRR